MKIILLLSVLFFSFVSFSQEEGASQLKTVSQSKTVSSPNETISVSQSNQSKSVTISKKAGQPQRVHDDVYFMEEIARVDSHISAIDNKVNTVNSDPQLKAEAEANNWFVQMADIKAELLLEKQELQTKLANY